jgi:xylose dehydrogenase (NAD/NADP)
MKLRWGFIGAGWIATTALARAVHEADNALLYAVASRDLQRSRSLEPVTIHNSYDDLINDPEVDAVYISLPNHLHCEWSIKALNAGKHVLCEKPLAMNRSEAELMFQAAVANKKLLVEAIWMRWHPRFARAQQLVKSGAIGDVQSINSIFTFNSALENNYRLSPDMGGGSFFDVGPYQVHLWSALLDPPLELQQLTVKSQLGSTGVDLTTEIHGQINSGVKVSAVTSFERDNCQKIVIRGSDSDIEFSKGEAFTSWKQASSLLVGGVEEVFAPVDPYALMIESFANHLIDGSSWVPSSSQSLQVAEIMDEIRSHI